MSFALKKVVLDTNTLISAAINANSISGAVYLYALRRCDLFRSAQTTHELETVLKRSFMDRYFQTDAPQTRDEFLERYKNQAKEIVVTQVVSRCIDPKDNMFLALAEAVGADYLVSGNIKHLNVLIEHAGTPIVTNRQFLADVAPALLMS